MGLGSTDSKAHFLDKVHKMIHLGRWRNIPTNSYLLLPQEPFQSSPLERWSQSRNRNREIEAFSS